MKKELYKATTFVIFAAALLALTIPTYAQAVQSCQWNKLPANQVIEAKSGFRSPVDFTSNRNGFDFLQKTPNGSYPNTCITNGWVYHPAWDMNYGSGYADYGKEIKAVADGIVVWIGKGNIQTINGKRERKMDEWASIIIQHNYKGRTYFSQYGHAQSVNGNFSCGQTVYKGWVIGKIGDVGALNNSHLHFEIRRGNHPNPTKGPYFCDKLPWDSTKYALQAVNSGTGKPYVAEWYEDPNPLGSFMQSLVPYR